jgi:RimJ/RimL family protein N-acetyltransferase
VLGRTVLKRLILIERDLSQPVEPIPCDLDFRMALLGPEEIDTYLAYRPERTRGELTQRFERGSVCFVAWIDGRIVSDAWYQRGEAWIEDIGRRFALERDKAYAYDAHTVPPLRGQSVAPARAALALDYLRQDGVRRAVAFVLPENGPARRSPVKSGWTPFGTAGFVRLGLARVEFVNTDARGRHWAVRRGGAPRDSMPALEPGGLSGGPT